MLFAGDDNVLDVFLDAEKRAAFNVMVFAVCDKLLDGFARGGKALDLVKDDATFTFFEGYMV